MRKDKTSDGEFYAWWVHINDNFSVSDTGGSEERKFPSAPNSSETYDFLVTD